MWNNAHRKHTVEQEARTKMKDSNKRPLVSYMFPAVDSYIGLI